MFFYKGVRKVAFFLLFTLLFQNQICLATGTEEITASIYPHSISMNGRYGYVNDAGKLVIPCNWEYAGEFRGIGYASVLINRQTQECGIIDTNGNYVIQFTGVIEEGQNGVYCGGMHTGVYWLQNDEHIGFFDVTTGYFSGFIFHHNQDIWHCSEATDLVRVSIDGTLYGYVNKTNGSVQIPYIFTGANFNDFVGGYTIDKINDTAVVFDEHGKFIRLPENLVPVSLGDFITVKDKENGLFGFADYSGNVVIVPQYEDVSPFTRGFASFLQNGKWGHIDSMGNLCGFPKYEEEYYFNGGSFVVKTDTKTLLIDQYGNVMRTFESGAELSYFTNELILVVCDGKTSLIDCFGKDVIKPECNLLIDVSQGCDVSEGLLLIRNREGYWGYADLAGNILCPCIWESASHFVNGWAVVEKENCMFYIDHSMNVVFYME